MANVNELLGNVNASIERMLKNNSAIEKDLALEKIRNLYNAVINFSATQKIETTPKPQPINISEPAKNISFEEKVVPIKISSNERSESLNEILIQNKKTELTDKLEHSPIDDLKFSGNADIFKNVVEQINSAGNFVEAEKIISNYKNEKWVENADAAASFMELVSRRFAKQS